MIVYIASRIHPIQAMWQIGAKKGGKDLDLNLGI